MAALAEEAREVARDLGSWHALQVWLESAEHRVSIPYAGKLAELIPPVAVRLRRDFEALLNLVRAHAILHQASRERDGKGRVVATIEDYAAVRELVADLVSEGIEATVPDTVRETVDAVRVLRGGSKGGPVTVAELARKLKLDRSAVSRRVRNAKDRGYLRDLKENPRRPSRLVLGDDLPADVRILPEPEEVRAGMRDRVSSDARPDGAREPPNHAQYSDDAYKACNRERVQEEIKASSHYANGGPGEGEDHQDHNLEELRQLFAEDALEEA
jgi:DNA-binding transcriptional ArsR family regulator